MQEIEMTVSTQKNVGRRRGCGACGHIRSGMEGLSWPQTPRPRHPGFTLVELLVVVSIIAMLVSILLPSLGRAKDAAKAVVCLNNQRVLGIALRYYAHDRNGRLPSAETFYEDAAPYLDKSLPDSVWDYKRENMPQALFCPCDSDPFPCPYMGGAFEVTSYLVNGAETDYAMGGGTRIALGLFGGKGNIDEPICAAECMLIGEATNYCKIADLDHPAAQAAFSAAGADLGGSRRRFHHRATSGFFHNGRMNVYFADGHGSAVRGKTVDPLPVSDWPSGALMDKTTAFYPTLSLPMATENPDFWGPPYDSW